MVKVYEGKSRQPIIIKLFVFELNDVSQFVQRGFFWVIYAGLDDYGSCLPLKQVLVLTASEKKTASHQVM